MVRLPLVASNEDLAAMSLADAPSGVARAGFSAPATAQDVVTVFLPSPSPCSVTASAGTASVSANRLTVATVTAGYVRNGLAIVSPIVPPGTIIVRQISGTPGGTGVYFISTSVPVPSPVLGFSQPGDGGAQVPSADGGSWQATPGNTRAFGTEQALYSFFTVTTVAGNAAVTLAGASFGNDDLFKQIVILGAGPFEQRYIGIVASVIDATHITVNPAPTQAMSAFSTICYIGRDDGPALNAAFAARALYNAPMQVEPGFHLTSQPIAVPITNLNNAGVPAGVITPSPGAVIIATANCSDSSPVAGALFTVGGYANGGDFSQFIRDSVFDFGGLCLDAGMVAPYAFSLPFFQDSSVSNLVCKNACSQNSISADMIFGSPGSPVTSAGPFIRNCRTNRDLFNVPIASVTKGNPTVITTAIDHGIPTGSAGFSRLIFVPAGSLGQPNPGQSFFQVTSSTHNTLTVPGDSSGWGSLTPGAFLNLCFPTDAMMMDVFGVTGANPAHVTVAGDDKLANGVEVGIFGLKASGTLTNAPDGIYTISNVGGVGGSGPTTFDLAGVDTTGMVFTGGAPFAVATVIGTIADIGLLFNNCSDVQINDSIITGCRWGVYAINCGYTGKYSNNHFYNVGQGQMMTAHYLYGQNTLTGEQVDPPALFHSWFNDAANTAQGCCFNSSGFGFIPDGQQWMYRVEASASLSVLGGTLITAGAAQRSSELSSPTMRGAPATATKQSNYARFGLGFYTPAGVLYSMLDAGITGATFTGATTGSFQSNGGVVNHQ